MAFEVFTETRVRSASFISINESQAFGFPRAFLDEHGITREHKAVLMYDSENKKIALQFVKDSVKFGFSVQIGNDKHGAVVKAKSFFERKGIDAPKYARRYHDFEKRSLSEIGIEGEGEVFVISLEGDEAAESAPQHASQPATTVEPQVIAHDDSDESSIVAIEQPNTSSGGSLFESIRRETEEGDEYWSARELAGQLDYSHWPSFDQLVQRAIAALREAGGDPVPHFVPGLKMVKIGQGVTRNIKDYQLSRLGSYLVAMNGDPDQKPRVAEAQNYFASKTRLQELNEAYQQSAERLREWSKYDESDRQLNDAIMEAGISARGLDQIRSGGDRQFFGGLDDDDMRALYGLAEGEVLADRMPTVLLSAKSFTNQMTKWKIENIGLYGVDAIDEEHAEHNRLNRQTLVDEGMVPEELPPEKDSISDVRKNIEGIQKQVLASE